MATNARSGRQKSVLKEGFLLKRQRGLSMNTDLRKLKFQQRFIQLSQSKLEYFTGKDAIGRNCRGHYSVKEITIVEKVPDVTFGKYFCFQIGNEREVMYFAAKSENERDAWVETFRIAAVTLIGNTMLSHYHTGAYGQVAPSKWSCCGATKRESPGCQKSTRHAHRDRASTTIVASSSKESEHDQEIKSETETEFVSQSLPGGYFHQEDEEGSDASEGATEEDYSHSQIVESPTEVDPHVKQLGRLSMFETQSVDSGLGMQANRRYESVTSLGVGEGLSPRSYRKRQQRKQKIVESNSEKSQSSISKPNSENWTLLRGIEMDKSTSVLRAVFRDAEVLITAYMDEKPIVQIAASNVTNSEEDGNVYKTAKAVGSIDTWRKYLAIGSPKLQLVDTSDWTWNKTLLNGEKLHHCAFKPDGSLVTAAYDSHILDIWPCVNSLHTESGVDSVEIKQEAQLSINDTTHIISSLSVSPNRDEPWLAVGLRVTENGGTHHVYVCDYVQNQQIWQQQLDVDSEKHVHRYSEHVTDVYTAFSHDGRQLAVGCGSYLKVFEPSSQNLIYSYPFPDASTTSISYSPTSAFLSIGLSSGQVKNFDKPLMSSGPKRPSTLPTPETPAAAVTSLTYSRDCQTLAVGYKNGALKLWNVPHKTSRSIELHLVRNGTLPVGGSTGVVHVLEDDAITISIPKGAIPQGTLKFGVLPHGPFGPFKFEDGVRPVSAILSIYPEPDVEFLEPIDLTIPIFIDCENEDDFHRLAIFKSCITESSTDKEGVYKMDEVTDGELTLFTDRKTRIQFVKVSVKHCCCYCVGEYFREHTNKANFCLVEAMPKHQLSDSQSKFTVDYCLPYCLPTCIKTIEEQYPDSTFKLSMRAVRFSDDSDRNDPAIQIKFQENLENGWKIMLKDGRNKIHRKDICFWDLPSPVELASMCSNKTYPPRFTVVIDGHRAVKDIETRVIFPGSLMVQGRNECCFSVSLNQPRIRRVTSGDSVTMTTCSTSSDQVHVECAIEALRSKMYEISKKVYPFELAMKLYSLNVIENEAVDKVNVENPTQKDVLHRNYDILKGIQDSLKDHPDHFRLLCEALNEVCPESKLYEEYKKNCRSSRSTSITRRRSHGSVSSASIKSFSSAQETFSNEQDEDHAHNHQNHQDQINGISENEQPSLVTAFMNGAAIAPHDNEPLPFPTLAYGPGPHYSSTEEMTQTVCPVAEADH